MKRATWADSDGEDWMIEEKKKRTKMKDPLSVYTYMSYFAMSGFCLPWL